MRRVESPTGTKVTDEERTEEASTEREDAPAKADERVVKIPEASEPSESRTPSDTQAAAAAAASSVQTAPQEATKEEADRKEAPAGEARPEEPPAQEAEPESAREPSPEAPTTRIPKVKKEEAARKRPRFSPSRLVVGAMLLLGGIAWLLDVTNTTTINWGVLLSLALLGAGAGLLLLGLRGGTNRGLMVLGVILAAILTAAAALRIDIAGGIGSQTVHPVSAKAFGKTYRMAVGQMTIDLRHVSFGNGSPKLRATVGVGQLVVLIPPGANMRVHARAGAGMVSAFAKTQSGLDVDHTFFRGSGSPAVILDLSVGVGQVTVHK